MQEKNKNIFITLFYGRKNSLKKICTFMLYLYWIGIKGGFCFSFLLPIKHKKRRQPPPGRSKKKAAAATTTATAGNQTRLYNRHIHFITFSNESKKCGHRCVPHPGSPKNGYQYNRHHLYIDMHHLYINMAYQYGIIYILICRHHLYVYEYWDNIYM